MAVANRYAFPAHLDKRFRGANICINRSTDTAGNGDYGDPGSAYDVVYDWATEASTPAGVTWERWIKPQIDAAHSLGANLIRYMFDATLRVGDASHHGAATWRGTITSGQMAACLDKLITYLDSLGMYFYATATESRPVAASGITLTQLRSYLSEYVGVVTDNAYTNVIGIDGIQEFSAGGSVVTTNLTALVADIKSYRTRLLPVTCSCNGVATAAGLSFDTSADLQACAAASMDFIDIHLYCPASGLLTITDFACFGSTPIILGEAGMDYNGNNASGSADAGSQARRAAFYDNLATLSLNQQFQCVAIWAITDQSTLDGNKWGIYSASQDGSWAFDSPRSEMTGPFQLIPKAWASNGAGTITLDNSADGGISIGVTHHEFNYTVGGSGNHLFVDLFGNTVTDNILTCKYNAVSMSLVNKVFVTGDRWLYSYYMHDPPTGTHEVRIDSDGTSIAIAAMATSYTGVNDMDNEATTIALAATSITASLTVGGQGNHWTHMATRNSVGAASAGTGATVRQSAANGLATFDSGGGVASGTRSEQATGSIASWGAIIVSLEPEDLTAVTLMAQAVM